MLEPLARVDHSTFQTLPGSSNSGACQPVIIRVCADPDPGHLLARQPAQGSVVISDANAEAIFASLQAAETEGGMARVSSPQMIVFNGKTLNLRWQCLE